MTPRRLAFALLVVLGAGCSTAGVTEIALPGTVRLGVGDRASITGTSWTLAFDSVTADSRCPIDADCIWAGEALLALKLINPLFDPLPGDSPEFTLGATPVTKYGFKFTTVEVAPAPRSTVHIDRRSYRVTLTVEAVGGS